MKYYDATQEFKPFERKGAANGHPRPRIGATKKKHRKQQEGK